MGGGELLDRRVELRLRGVAAAAVAYGCLDPEVRPSKARIPAGLVLPALTPWPLPPGAAELWFLGADLRPLEEALRVDWFAGDGPSGTAAPIRAAVALGPSEPTDAPPELLIELRRWFEGGPDAGDGRWGYARTIDRWWLEGARAYVRVRGIEHSSPTDRQPAENVESVWDLGLRLRGGAWQLTQRRQGWPPYGSADKRPARKKPWLRRWRSGRVVS